MSEKVTVRQAAQLSSLGVSTIRRWATESVFKAEKIDEEWLIDKESFLAYLARKTQPIASSKPKPATNYSDEAYHQLALDTLAKERATIEFQRAEITDLRAENKALQIEVRVLQSEIRALLQGALGNNPSPWVRSAPTIDPGEPKAQPLQSESKIELTGEEQIAIVPALKESPEESSKPAQSELIAQNPSSIIISDLPKITESKPLSEFAQNVKNLLDQGKNEQEIAKELGKKVVNVRVIINAILRKN